MKCSSCGLNMDCSEIKVKIGGHTLCLRVYDKAVAKIRNFDYLCSEPSPPLHSPRFYHFCFLHEISDVEDEPSVSAGII